MLQYCTDHTPALLGQEENIDFKSLNPNEFFKIKCNTAYLFDAVSDARLQKSYSNLIYDY